MLSTLLFAADQPQEPPGAGAPFWVQLAPFLAIAVAFYFLMLLPMRKQEKQRKALVAALKKNDKVLNSGGIIGVVESVKDQEDEVVLRGGLRVTKSSIVKVFGADGESKEQKAGGGRNDECRMTNDE